jgi:hypothetical protein
VNRLPMSAAASALLRALIARSGAPRDRILLSDVRSVDWQSLTLTGERHEFQLRVPRPASREVVECMCAGLDEVEFSIPGVIVADIGVVGEPCLGFDGSSTVTIEALTVVAD